MFKVGIIDSGINVGVIRGQIKNIALFGDKFNIEKDWIGHGTMCANIIEKYSGIENIEFYSAKIFDYVLHTSTDMLVEALNYFKNNKVDLINLSLSIDVLYDRKIVELIKQINENGTIIVASKSNQPQSSLLDFCENVFSVSGSSLFNGEVYWTKEKDIVCDIEPILLRWNEDDYDFFGGNSKATALFSAIILKRWKLCKNNFNVKNLVVDAEEILNKNILRRQINSFEKYNIELDYEREIHYCKAIGSSFKKMENYIKKYKCDYSLDANKIANYIKNVLKINPDEKEIFMEFFQSKSGFAYLNKKYREKIYDI